MIIDPNERVPVSDEQGNVIYIRPKMDLATRTAALDELLEVDGRDPQNPALRTVRVGMYNLILLRHNILAWEGPAFRYSDGRAIPCTPETIGQLDPDEPLVQRVLAEIDRRNRRPTSPDPKSPTGPGSTGGGGAS